MSTVVVTYLAVLWYVMYFRFCDAELQQNMSIRQQYSNIFLYYRHRN